MRLSVIYNSGSRCFYRIKWECHSYVLQKHLRIRHGCKRAPFPCTLFITTVEMKIYVSMNFLKILLYHISWKSVQDFSSCYIFPQYVRLHSDGLTDRRMEKWSYFHRRCTEKGMSENERRWVIDGPCWFALYEHTKCLVAVFSVRNSASLLVFIRCYFHYSVLHHVAWRGGCYWERGC